MPSTPSNTDRMSSRDVWLTVALAVARDGEPVPDEVELRPAHHGLHPRVTIHYDGHLGHGVYSRPAADTLAMAEQAARILGLDEFSFHPDGIRWQWQAWDRRGWVWEVVAHTPEGTVYEPGAQPAPGPLGEQVIAAIGGAS